MFRWILWSMLPTLRSADLITARIAIAIDHPENGRSVSSAWIRENILFPFRHKTNGVAYDTQYVRSVVSEPVTVVVQDPNTPQAALILPADLIRNEDRAFAGFLDITVQLSDKVEHVAPIAFDPSVTVIAPEGSAAVAQRLEYVLTVVVP